MNGKLPVYAITWVPDPKQIGIRPTFQYDTCLPYLRQLSLCCEDYKIVPELTLNGNIHFHGMISLFDKVKFYKKVLPTLKYRGHVLLKEVFSDYWEKVYLQKTVDEMKLILGNNREVPILHPHTRHTPSHTHSQLDVL